MHTQFWKEKKHLKDIDIGVEGYYQDGPQATSVSTELI
jgi:hypothetical protein